MVEPDPHTPPDRGPVERDLELAETIGSSAMQGSVALGGPGALLMIPVATALTALGAALRRTVRRTR